MLSAAGSAPLGRLPDLWSRSHPGVCTLGSGVPSGAPVTVRTVNKALAPAHVTPDRSPVDAQRGHPVAAASSVLVPLVLRTPFPPRFLSAVGFGLGAFPQPSDLWHLTCRRREAPPRRPVWVPRGGPALPSFCRLPGRGQGHLRGGACAMGTPLPGTRSFQLTGPQDPAPLGSPGTSLRRGTAPPVLCCLEFSSDFLLCLGSWEERR